MTLSLGRNLLARLGGTRFNKFPRAIVVTTNFCTSAVWKSAENGNPVGTGNSVSGAVLKKFSEPVVVENIDLVKTLKTNEVLIDVNYCALNAADALLSKNMYTFEPSLPMVLGYEFVGKLVEIGDQAAKHGYKVGDNVVVLNKDHYGGLAEQCVAEVADIWKVPSSVRSLDAVSLLDNYITALIALEREVSIQEDDMILINVGVSGIGLAAVDLATNVFRAKVISVCATEEGADLARDKGVVASLKYKGRKLLKQIEEVAAEKDIKAIFDDKSGDYFKKVLDCFTEVYKTDATSKDLLRDDNFAVVVQHLSRQGRVIVAGSAAVMCGGECAAQEDSFGVSGLNLREYRKAKPEIYRQAAEDVFQFLEEGLITPTRSLVVGLNKVNDAIRFILERKTPGKVIIDIRNKDAEPEKSKK